MQNVLLLFLCGAVVGIFPRPIQAQIKVVDFNGYLQVRSIGSRAGGAVSLRRTKLWIKGHDSTLPVSFKVQSLFRWSGKGELDLQDAYAEYSPASFQLRVGQFVPDFSLEWCQPDAAIPLLDRARVVDALIPGSRTMGREIGAQVRVVKPRLGLTETFGLFKGDGASVRDQPNRDYLLTNRIVFDLTPGGWPLQTGYSAAYRRISAGEFPSLLGPGVLYSGTGLRQGVEGRLKIQGWTLQGEYFRADLAEKRSRGGGMPFSQSTFPRKTFSLFQQKHFMTSFYRPRTNTGGKWRIRTNFTETAIRSWWSCFSLSHQLF